MPASTPKEIKMGREEWKRKGYGVDGNKIARRASISIEKYADIKKLPVGHYNTQKPSNINVNSLRENYLFSAYRAIEIDALRVKKRNKKS